MPLGEEAPAAFIFSSRQLRQRQPAAGASAAGIGMTCGSSAHQQPSSFLQIIGALHWEQRVSTGKLWGGGRGTSSASRFAALGSGRFLVSGAKRVLSWMFAGGWRNTRGRWIFFSCNTLREIRTRNSNTLYPYIQRQNSPDCGV